VTPYDAPPANSRIANDVAENIEYIGAAHLTVRAGPPLKARGTVDQAMGPRKAESGWIEIPKAAPVERVGIFENHQVKAEALDLLIGRFVPPAKLGDKGNVEITDFGAVPAELPVNPTRRAGAMTSVDAIVLASNVMDSCRPAQFLAAHGTGPADEACERV
jgi:hypothetical protein